MYGKPIFLMNGTVSPLSIRDSIISLRVAATNSPPLIFPCLNPFAVNRSEMTPIFSGETSMSMSFEVRQPRGYTAHRTAPLSSATFAPVPLRIYDTYSTHLRKSSVILRLCSKAHFSEFRNSRSGSESNPCLLSVSQAMPAIRL